MLACPACGEVAPPGIVVPHDRWYECPSCGERTPRAELDPLRLKSVFRGGTPPARLLLTLVSTASMTDGLQNTLTIVSGSFSVVAGDLLVAYLTSWAGSDDVGVGAATVSNGEGAMTVQLYAGVNAGLAGVLLSRNISTTGTRTITIQFNNIPLPKSATLAVYRLRLAGYTLGLENGAILYTASTASPTSGLTGALLGSNDTALAFIGSTQLTSDPAPTLTGGYTRDGRDGTNQGFDDCSITVGSKPLTNNDRVSADATFLVAYGCVACVAAVRAT